MLILISRLIIQSDVRAIGKKPSVQQKIDLGLKRSRLASRISEHQRRANVFLHVRGEPEEYDFEIKTVFVDGDDGEIAMESVPSNDPFVGQTDGPVPENFKIALPSSMSQDIRKRRDLKVATDWEIELRIGQCNDALQGVRLSLGKKAFLFRTQVRSGGPKTGKTRPWDAIHAADATLRQHAQLYRSSRAALEKLQPDEAILRKYQVLEAHHLKTSTTLLDTSQHGQRHDRLPWFWYLDVTADTETGLYECKFF